MKLTGLTRMTARVAAGVLVAAGLALSAGVQPVAADDELPPPRLQSLRLDGTDAYVTFKDTADRENGFQIILRERDQPDRIARDIISPGGVPGVGRETTRSISGIAPGVAVCATVSALGYDETTVFIVGVPVTVYKEVSSGKSNAVCADPNSGPPADVAVERVGGKEEVEWTKVSGQTPAYLVVVRNDGAAAEGTVVVEVATSGVATLATDQSLVRPGWAAGGFTCVATQPGGGANAGLRCTGGSLKQGEKINPAVLVRFTGRGYGHIHVSVSLSGGPAEADTKDNGLAHNVRVY